MKTKLLLSSILSFYFCLLSSQIPQGFNYQAIARDATTHNPIINTALPVRITVQSDSLGGTVFWQELHSAVTTNSFGLFNLVLGKGSKTVGTELTFSNIDWSVTPKYIMTEIDHGGWINMGSSRLWTVPYAMVAGDLNDTLKKLIVKSQTSVMDESLFEVKNKDGQTVFAVYNEGVRIYVDDHSKGAKGGFAVGGFGPDKAGNSQKYLFVSGDSIRAYIFDDPLIKTAKGGFSIGGFNLAKKPTNDYLLISADSSRVYVNNAPSTKGAKGGFAIGGFDPTTKGTIPQKLLTVSDDSIRMYINDKGTKSAKGGFAIGGFDQTKGNNANFLSVSTDNNGIVKPSQNRVLWYPMLDKNAFLVGKVIIEAPDSVGINSVSTGFESRAKGNYSQAFGYQAIARGLYSTAIGNQAVAHKDNSFALGENAYAGNNYTYAFGRNAKATGLSSFALGEGVQATNYNSYALGNYSRATGYSSYAFGDGTLASGANSIAFGRLSQATDSSSFASGEHAVATKKNSFALGKESVASGISSYALGESAVASNQNAFALGKNANASGFSSFAFGENAQASNSNSVAMGKGAIASGVGSYAFGSYGREYIWTPNFESNTMASGNNSFAAGMGAVAIADKSISIGFCTQATGAVSIAMGFGSIAGDQHSSIAMGEYAKSTGYASVSLGWWTIATGIGSVALGKATLALTDACFATGSFNLGLPNSLFELGNGTAEGAGRSNALTVLNNGNLGLGTSAPSEKLEIGGSASKIFLNSSLSNTLIFNTNGVDMPTFSTRSAGTKIVLYPSLTSSAVDYAMGIEPYTLWYSIAEANSLNAFKFYAGTSEIMRLSGDGNLGIGCSNPWSSGSNSKTLTLKADDYPEYFLYSSNAPSDNKIWRFLSRPDGSSQIQTMNDSYSGESTVIGMLHNGNVGIGTSTPTKKLEVNGDALFNGNTVSSGYLRVVGYPAPILTGTSNQGIYLGWNKSTNTGEANFINQRGNGSGGFTFENTDGTTTTRLLTILGSGNVGIGTTLPGYALEVVGNAAKSSGGTTWTVSSDSRLKDIHGEYSRGIEDIMKLKSVLFNYKEGNPRRLPSNDEYIGFVAQDVLPVFPEAVTTGSDGYLDFNMHPVNVAMVNAVQQEQREIESLKSENQQLKSKLQSLQEKMEQIEVAISKSGAK